MRIMTWGTRSARSGAPAVVVGIMDRDLWTARTDNIVVVEPVARRLTWIPRDLWSDEVGDRINVAYARGGHALFQAALAALGCPVTESIVLLRAAAERTLDGVSVTVPVDRVRRYWYPLEPTLRLQDGAKLVEFTPPVETLSGERLHQWIGARRSAGGPRPLLPDLDRIARQQVLVRSLLASGADFGRAIAEPAQVAISGDGALALLAAVRADWTMRTFDRVEAATRGGMQVLVRRRGLLLRAFRGGQR